MADQNENINGGLDLELGSGDLELGDFEETPQSDSSLEDLLGVSDLDLSTDDNLFDGDDGSNLDLDLEGLDIGAEEELNASTLLRTQNDVSQALKEYYQLGLNAVQKLFPPDTPKDIKQMVPPISDFSFIPDKNTRNRVYGYFVQMLDDLTTDSKYEELNEEQAYGVLKEEIFKDLHWTPNIHDSKLRHCFTAYYERNKKLSRANVVSREVAVTSYVDRDRLNQSVNIYYVNSMPFEIATRFFRDETLIHEKGFISTQYLGAFADSVKKNYGTRELSYMDAYHGIIEFLTSPDTLGLLDLTQEDVVYLSTGELLRRYLLLELNDGTFYPMNMKKLASQTVDSALMQQIVGCLLTAIKRQSFAAEILYMVMSLMQSNAKNTFEQREYFEEFTLGICRYLSAFANDKAAVNPVFYGFIGNAGEADGKQVFELAYADMDRSVSFKAVDILYEVIGDNNNVYQVPLVYRDEQTNCVVCPPNEVVSNIRAVTGGGRVNVTGKICYHFVPSFGWLSTLNLASDIDEDIKSSSTKNSVRNNNPLLDTLMHYSNDFDKSGEDPEVIALDSNSGNQILGVRQSVGERFPILQLSYQGSPVSIQNGFCLIDSDGTAVVQYTDTRSQTQNTDIFNEGEYKVEVVETHVASDAKAYPGIQELLDVNPELGEHPTVRFLRAVAVRICDLVSLDYESELESVREIIIRDLPTIIGSDTLAPLIGRRLLQNYVAIADKMGTLDGFNYEGALQAMDMVYGRNNRLAGTKVCTDESLQILRVSAQDTSVVREFADRIRMYDAHVIALQGISRSEMSRKGDRLLYDALHFIPEVHALLRSLEDQMVLIRVLEEIGGEIESIFRKNSAMLTAYKTVCTQEFLGDIERKLRVGMHAQGSGELPVTRAVLNNAMPESFAILKYFALDYSVLPLLAGLEELEEEDKEKYEHLFTTVKKGLGLPDSTKFGGLNESEFMIQHGAEAMALLYDKSRSDVVELVSEGLIVEAGSKVPIQVLKAYDMLYLYGHLLFNLQEDAAEDYTDVSKFASSFYTYVGSMILSYCPVIGEAANEIDGGIDRLAAYMKNMADFVSYVSLGQFSDFNIFDMKTIGGIDEKELFGEESK